MGLEDFERELAEQRSQAQTHKRKREQGHDGKQNHGPSDRVLHHHHRRRRHHHDKDRLQPTDPLPQSRHKYDSNELQSQRRKHRQHDHERTNYQEASHKSCKPHSAPLQQPRNEANETAESPLTTRSSPLQRDTWMQTPSAMNFDYVKPRSQQSAPSLFMKASEQDCVQHVNSTDLSKTESMNKLSSPPPQDSASSHEITYTFGDAGSSWRMTKLRATYRQAKESNRNLEDIAIERYGNLKVFDDAREEEVELDRRERYGREYNGRDKPSGELYKSRNLSAGGDKSPQGSNFGHDGIEDVSAPQATAPTSTVALDQTALNKLKAQMMKAKARRASNADELEFEYKNALFHKAIVSKNDIITLDKMDSRLLAGTRTGEYKSIDNKRGRERQLVEENEDMSIEDMVRNERRTRGQFGGEGKAFAERIAKDGKFNNDLDYLDDNAAQLAKTGQKSEINLRNTAIGDYQKMKRILDDCPLCHHEDSGKGPRAPLVSLATRTFLTLPTSPEITPYGLCASIVPMQHRLNLLECDDDEWEEIRNFMKSLTRFYWSQTPRLSVVFYENAAHEGRKRHASMEAVPLPPDLATNASAFFKEAILAADEEWTQHRKVIDTLAKANDGLGKLAFRRSMVSNLPYFHVWLTIDGGLGHVVEDARRWPKGDLFAREIIGGMLDVGPDVIKRQGRWIREDFEMAQRIKEFHKGWEKWDWTKALVESI